MDTFYVADAVGGGHAAEDAGAAFLLRERAEFFFELDGPEFAWKGKGQFLQCMHLLLQFMHHPLQSMHLPLQNMHLPLQSMHLLQCPHHLQYIASRHLLAGLFISLFATASAPSSFPPSSKLRSSGAGVMEEGF